MERICNQCNKIKNTTHNCPDCKYTTCRNCLQKYILSKYPIKCLRDECKRVFTKGDLMRMFGQNWFYSTYWRYLESNHVDNVDKVKLDELKKSIEHLHILIERANSNFYRQRQVLYSKIEDLRLTMFAIRNAKPGVEKKQNCLIRNCPKDECLGMIPINKDEKAECTLCGTVLCKECLECVRDEHGETSEQREHSETSKHSEHGEHSEHSEHECDEKILESVKAIFQDTKQCPGCGISIFKIEGCYQMWCTQCHTTFHYRTGEVLNERIHNPHYVEWLNSQKRGRQQPAEEHGLNYTTISSVANEKQDSVNFIQNVLRVYLHIHMVEIPAMNGNINDIRNQEYQKEKRAYYIMKKWNEQFYKDWLYKQDMLSHKYNHLLDIYTQVDNYLETVLTSYINDSKLKFPDISVKLNEINQKALEYSRLYENKFPQFIIENNELHTKTRMEKLRLVHNIVKGDECQVCVNVFNKTIRKKITCQDCQFTMCTQCSLKYLLESINEPCCMNCKKEWNRSDLVKYFGMHMYTHKFKPHKKDVLFEREKIHISDTMELVERLKLIDQIMIERGQLYRELNANETEYKNHRQKLFDEIETTNKKIWEIKQFYLPK